MTELEKLNRGFPYCFFDEEVGARKERANDLNEALNRIPANHYEEQLALIKQIFGSTRENVYIQPPFYFDVGDNIHVGAEFLTNFNVTILDVAPVHIGDYCMIGPNTLITTVNHPLDYQGRRDKFGVAKGVTIGDDVWIGGNVTILPGVNIGSRVVIAAGAVVTQDVPDDTLVGGVPARVIKSLKEI